MKTKTIMFAILVVIALFLVVYFLIGNNNSTTTGNAIAETSSDNVVFNLTSSHLRFFLNGVESPVLKVKEGDRVKIILNNEEGFHDWVLDEFTAATKQINAGMVDYVEFVADKKGTFEYYCSVGKHRVNGMKGTFIVE